MTDPTPPSPPVQSILSTPWDTTACHARDLGVHRARDRSHEGPACEFTPPGAQGSRDARAGAQQLSEEPPHRPPGPGLRPLCSPETAALSPCSGKLVKAPTKRFAFLLPFLYSHPSAPNSASRIHYRKKKLSFLNCGKIHTCCAVFSRSVVSDSL